jgi:hypothetical protein
LFHQSGSVEEFASQASLLLATSSGTWVRIDIINYDPEKLPLFVGLSVEPSVDLRSPPTGANAGKFLQELVQQNRLDRRRLRE